MPAQTSTPNDAVTVVTVTRNRPHLLKRAIESVAGQCCRHVSVHLVMVDDCRETWRSLGRTLPPAVWPRMMERDGTERTGPRRIARLRDTGADLARTKWVVYLDDDNEWEPDHLHSLLETAAASGSPAVHTWAQVFHADGRKFLERRSPWHPDEEAYHEYERLWRLGVVEPGSHVFKDRLDEHGGPDSVRTVDMGAWLLETELVRRIRFSDMRAAPSRKDVLAEDDFFNENLVAAGVRVRTTGRATLRYYLGGHSTAPEDNEPADW